MRPAEGRHELRAVLSSQTTGRPGAHVNEPPGPTQSALYRKSRSLDRRPRGSHGRDGGKLPFDHRLQNLGRFPDVDLGVARALAFSLRITHRSNSS